jgi:hypothetical protein
MRSSSGRPSGIRHARVLLSLCRFTAAVSAAWRGDTALLKQLVGLATPAGAAALQAAVTAF